MVLFAESFQHLPLGKAYRIAWRDLLGIQKRLSIIQAYPNAYPDSDSARTRRDYIEQLEKCDTLLGKLERQHHWPPS